MTAVPAGPGVSSPPDSWVRMSRARAEVTSSIARTRRRFSTARPEFARRVPAHGDVVLLHGGARDGVD